jgi:DNA-binding NtrC family response regulator
MHPCRIIVCEKTTHWASALRSELSGATPQITEIRSLSACESELSQLPASLVALEVTLSNCEASLDFIVRTREKFPGAVIVALVSHEPLDATPLLREAGVIDVIASVLEIPRLARLARRKFILTPQPEVSLRESVFQRMPWATYASAVG